MTAGRPTRRELLVGSVFAAVAAGVVESTHAGAAEDFAKLAESVDGAAPAEHPAGRLGTHRLIWSVPNELGLVGLTFDDGPTQRYTPRVLEVLRDAGAFATFNVVGVRAVAHPGLLREIVAAGHEIGNHTHHHQDLSQVGPDQARTEIRAAQDAIEQCVQAPVTVFRPPRGELTGASVRVAAELGLDVVMWSLTRDVAGVGSVDDVVASLTGRAEAGDVIGLHDGLGHAGFRPGSAMARLLQRRRDIELRALPHVLARFAERGLHGVSVRQLLEAADGRRT